jgi:hypothetical protein
MSIDLHVHSNFSDGSMTPAELVQYAHRKGLSAIAITDHDAINGIAEAIDIGNRLGMEIVPGVELSVKHGDCALHLLGYLFQRFDQALLLALHRLQEGRLARNKVILANLNRLGIDIDLPELEKISGHGQGGRPHIAQLLIQKGAAENMDEAFARYLAKGGSAYAPRLVFQAEEAIALINNAGGIAVLAHPQQLAKSGEDVPAIIANLKAMGLAGIEVYYPTHSRQVRRKLMATAKKFDLLLTGGSDYHGTIRPGTALAGGKNCSVPMNLLDEMKRHLEQS